MKKLLAIAMSCVAVYSVHATVQQQDIDLLFSALQGSQRDSGFLDVNSILIKYKSNPDDMKSILSARATVNGVANSTPLHIAVQGGNVGLCGIIFQKASVVGTAAYKTFAPSLVNAVDGNNKTSMDYALQQSDASVRTALVNILKPQAQLGSSQMTTTSGGSSASSGSSGASSSGQNSLSSDITALFNAIANGNSSAARTTILKYKNDKTNLQSLLSARTSLSLMVGGATTTVNNLTPLHLAAYKSDIATIGQILSKASSVNSSFGRTLANMVDSISKKPVDYATDETVSGVLAGLTDTQ